MKKLLVFIFLFKSYSGCAQDTTYKKVTEQLLLIDELDQRYRNQLDDNPENKEIAANTKKTIYKNMHVTDSLNLIQVEAILQEYGWLGPDKIGSQANTAIFMVIQHSDLKTQEKYLPVMQKAVENKNAKASNYAMLQDRVNVMNGRKQVYGSQLLWSNRAKTYYVIPLVDPDNVDKRRTEVGLAPMAVYLSEMDLKWDLEQYKKDLPAFEIDFKTITLKK